MFAKKNKVFFLKNIAFRENLVTISSASLLLFSGVSLAQTQANPLLDTLTQPSITHILFRVSITPICWILVISFVLGKTLSFGFIFQMVLLKHCVKILHIKSKKVVLKFMKKTMIPIQEKILFQLFPGVI